MRTTRDFLAIDLGAASGRVMLGAWNGEQISLSELHRFTHAPVSILDHSYWDVLKLWAGIENGLCRYVRDYHAAPAGIGVDAWGVDFALIDSMGHLLGNPCSYRDARTEGLLPIVFQRISEEELFRRTGVQCWQINTLFQLTSMVRNKDSQMGRAATMLMIPDLFSYWLTGEKVIEHTIASTSQMLVRGKTEWIYDVLRSFQIPLQMLPSVVGPATVLAPLREEIGIEVGLSFRPPILLVASHDTASAVAAIPNMNANSAFISSGTWSLVGVEVSEAVITKEALQRGFSNEQGAGPVLLLRNVAGLWLFQECMRQWQLQGHSYEWTELVAMADDAEAFNSLIDPDAADFVAPSSMLTAIRRFCHRTRQTEPESPAAFVRCVVESLSLRYREVLESLEEVTKRKLSTIRIVGGGSQNHLLCQLTADVTGRVVVTGPVEASALGNIMMQAVATGSIANAAEGREVIAASIQQLIFESRPRSECENAYFRFRELCKSVSTMVSDAPLPAPLTRIN